MLRYLQIFTVVVKEEKTKRMEFKEKENKKNFHVISSISKNQ